MSPIVSPRRLHERSDRPALHENPDRATLHRNSDQPTLSVLSSFDEPDVSPMDGLDTTEPNRPALRIVARDSHGVTPVLLAGADARSRAVLRAEFSATLAPCTQFSEADEVSELLEHAQSSRMVILAGDLDDADAGSMVRLLGRRHPQLPVISVDTATPVAAGEHG